MTVAGGVIAKIIMRASAPAFCRGLRHAAIPSGRRSRERNQITYNQSLVIIAADKAEIYELGEDHGYGEEKESDNEREAEHYHQGEDDHDPPRQPPSQMSKLTDIGSRSIFDTTHDAFREMVRRIVKDYLSPMQDEMERRTGGLPTKEMWLEMGEDRFSGYNAKTGGAIEASLLGLCVPGELGGMSGSFKHSVILAEEQIYAGCPSPALMVHSGLVVPCIVEHGTEAQKDRFLPGMMTGERIGAVAMLEADAPGLDLQSIQTNARRDRGIMTSRNRGTFVLNGRKTAVANGNLADTFLVAAKTGDHGISIFLVEEKMLGFEKRLSKKLGEMTKGGDLADLSFVDVRVGRDNLLGGEEGLGTDRLMKELSRQHLLAAVMAAASAERAYEETRRYVGDEFHRKKTQSELKMIDEKITEIKVPVAVCRAFVDQCVQQFVDGTLDCETAAMATSWAVETEDKVVGDCLKIFGKEGEIGRKKIDQDSSRMPMIYGGRLRKDI